MNPALKQTMFAMAAAALSLTAACKKNTGPTATETEAAAEENAAQDADAEGSCGEGGCGEGKCGGSAGDEE